MNQEPSVELQLHVVPLVSFYYRDEPRSFTAFFTLFYVLYFHRLSSTPPYLANGQTTYWSLVVFPLLWVFRWNDGWTVSLFSTDIIPLLCACACVCVCVCAMVVRWCVWSWPHVLLLCQVVLWVSASKAAVVLVIFPIFWLIYTKGEVRTAPRKHTRACSLSQSLARSNPPLGCAPWSCRRSGSWSYSCCGFRSAPAHQGCVLSPALPLLALSLRTHRTHRTHRTPHTTRFITGSLDAPVPPVDALWLGPQLSVGPRPGPVPVGAVREAALAPPRRPDLLQSAGVARTILLLPTAQPRSTVPLSSPSPLAPCIQLTLCAVCAVVCAVCLGACVCSHCST
jgi:hypothetical protein